ARSGAFFCAYWLARPEALPGVSGSACAPASAAASAVDWRFRFARYHEPTSRTSADIPSIETRKTTVRTSAWPLWFRFGVICLFSVVSVDELNGVCAEVRAAAPCGRRRDAVPDDLGEVASDRSAA